MSENRNSVVVRSEPNEGESLLGYLVRIAELNGYPRITWLYSQLGVDLYHSSPTILSEHLDRLSEVLGQPVPTLAAMANHDAGSGNASKILFGGRHEIPQHSLENDKLKVCPECLRENGFIKAVWD